MHNCVSKLQHNVIVLHENRNSGSKLHWEKMKIDLLAKRIDLRFNLYDSPRRAILVLFLHMYPCPLELSFMFPHNSILNLPDFM